MKNLFHKASKAKLPAAAADDRFCPKETASLNPNHVLPCHQLPLTAPTPKIQQKSHHSHHSPTNHTSPITHHPSLIVIQYHLSHTVHLIRYSQTPKLQSKAPSHPNPTPKPKTHFGKSTLTKTNQTSPHCDQM